MVALRGLADEHWHNLLSFADYTLPPETVRFINFSNFAWTSLEKLLLALMGPSEVYSGTLFPTHFLYLVSQLQYQLNLNPCETDI